MSYFNNFSVFQYDVNGDGDRTVLTDFTPNFKISNEKLIKSVSYMRYQIIDGERPDVVSYKLYNRPDYHWTFFVVNDSLRRGHSDWPMSQLELDSYISNKYDAYSVVVFDPTVIPSDDIGNLSYIDFNASGGSLYLYPVAEDDTSSAGHKIHSYDYSSCQLVFERKDKDGNEMQDLNDYEYYRIEFESNTDAIAPATMSDDEISYIANLKAAYGITDPNIDVYSIRYKVAIDTVDNKINNKQLKNAAYQYYTLDEERNEPKSLTGYDVVCDGINDKISYANVSKITYAEMETIINDRKEFIDVIHPSNINDFVSSYLKVLTENGR